MKKGKQHQSKRTKRKRPAFKRKELKLEELEAIVEKTKAVLSEQDHENLKGAVDTLVFLTQELEAKGVSIKRLRKLLFGASTEKTSKVVGDKASENSGTLGTADEAGSEASPEKKKRKGHGRNGAAAYRGADKVKVGHESLKRGEHCPECQRGKVYPLQEPSVLVRVKGMAPLQATVYELERLRCNLCGQVFTAQTPEGVGGAKYDETAAAMIGLLKYGCGLPFNRMERLERNLGIPLPAATQWEVVAEKATLITPAYEELVCQAAQGKVLHNDDTTAKILELERRTKQDALMVNETSDESPDGVANERTGVFTSGIVSVGQQHKVALFFTGRKHAGENLADVLAKRAKELGPPIQMCDLLSRNTSSDFETIVAGCMSHSRRRYVDVVDNFPDEVRHVLEELKTIYKNDEITRQKKMSDEERLRFHQDKSQSIMDELKKWIQDQLDERKVEPNSGLGEAISFMLKHWDKLTKFLQVAGAPLDNNICERALKKAILHRKNALFYKTQNGARVGDMYMTFIHTAELNRIDSFDYLVALMRYHEEVAKDPSSWMPWNYEQVLARLTEP